MTEKDFLDFANEQYKSDVADIEVIYTRVTMLLTVLVIIGGASIAVGDIRYLVDPHPRAALVAYSTLTALTVAALFMAGLCLVPAAFPREYDRLATIQAWRKWRADCKRALTAKDPGATESSAAALANATSTEIVRRLAQAQGSLARINQRRLRYFQYAMMCAVIGAVCLAGQALMYLLVKVSLP